MNKISFIVFALLSVFASGRAVAQGWPAQYGGVMLQGFYWNSYTDTQWSYLESQSDEISRYFSLIWVPQSGNCGGGNNMGYMPLYYFDHNSSFGSEAQLRSMISTFKKKGTGIIADVVINHRNTMTSWTDFAQEKYHGADYSMNSTDICRDDDNGSTLQWASKNSVSLSPNNDTGEGWPGCRDLDHKSANVNRVVKAYLKYLHDDLGYLGYRYDMVKGYSPAFTGDYNSSVNAEFSVGEFWDGNATTVQNWINGTKVNDVIQSAAFDFAFRYTCRDAVNGQASSTLGTSNWAKLNTTTSATNPVFRRYAVTFVENHDTEYRSASEQQDPIRRDTLACNAWLIANPGTPCVFYRHWIDCKHDIKLMIEARKLVGITNESNYSNRIANASYCAREVKGSNGSLIVVVGNGCNNYAIPAGYSELISGYHYRYLVSNTCNTSSWTETVTRINDEDKAEEFAPHKATIYCKANFTPLYFYAWDSKTSLNGNWPGKQPTQTAVIDGETWYCQTFDVNTPGYEFNIIFNQGNGKPQTVDIGHLSSDRYFIATLSGSKVDYTDVTSLHTGILQPMITETQGNAPSYSITGQRVDASHKGIIITKGKKYLRK